MSDAKVLDLDFAGLGEGVGPKPDKETTRRIAAETGSAEGFTNRSLASAPIAVTRRVHNIQMNLKVPPEFRERFQAAFLEDSAHDRSIRSSGEFLMKIFEYWERR